MHDRKLLKLTAIIGTLMIAITSSAEDFCVTNSGELVAALTTAANNNEADVISIENGSYLTPPGGFRYLSNQIDDLTISGGYINSSGMPCAASTTPAATYLDGDSADPVMRIQNSSTGDTQIKISGINFINGGGDSLVDVGGLLISAGFLSSDASITLENNSFINNTAEFVAGLEARTSVGKFIIRNNLFTLNQSTNTQFSFNPNVLIRNFPNAAQKLYFTNNTVVNNVGAGAHIFQYEANTSQVLVANNIFWNNDTTDLHLEGDISINFLHHNNIGVQTGMAADDAFGNISEAPIFEQGPMNFTPSIYSSVVSGGIRPPLLSPIPVPFEDDWDVGSTDLQGNSRWQGSEIDMGAIESPHLDQQELPIFKNGFETW